MTMREYWQDGYRAGLAAWRPDGRHEIPPGHPGGGSRAGEAWFRGCVEGLKDAEKNAVPGGVVTVR
ncbi:hypothetical protein OKA05_28550 [Luteolibacter arcticus]|uniref:Ribosome modulation factor n=1 Tax=Luteolibacter arcticus TaxID=1581411 RepID=A0ABT3GSP1_9BACT|nr:hypothetical protein [Luteolibacter arcticus]MCW1926536.1 hypothetical protein [Luteolibacter arcticus]